MCFVCVISKAGIVHISFVYSAMESGILWNIWEVAHKDIYPCFRESWFPVFLEHKDSWKMGVGTWRSLKDGWKMKFSIPLHCIPKRCVKYQLCCWQDCGIGRKLELTLKASERRSRPKSARKERAIGRTTLTRRSPRRNWSTLRWHRHGERFFHQIYKGNMKGVTGIWSASHQSFLIWLLNGSPVRVDDPRSWDGSPTIQLAPVTFADAGIIKKILCQIWGVGVLKYWGFWLQVDIALARSRRHQLGASELHWERLEGVPWYWNCTFEQVSPLSSYPSRPMTLFRQDGAWRETQGEQPGLDADRSIQESMLVCMTWGGEHGYCAFQYCPPITRADSHDLLMSRSLCNRSRNQSSSNCWRGECRISIINYLKIYKFWCRYMFCRLTVILTGAVLARSSFLPFSNLLSRLCRCKESVLFMSLRMKLINKSSLVE